MTTRSEKRVIPLELFFDLVFVFALTEVIRFAESRSRVHAGAT